MFRRLGASPAAERPLAPHMGDRMRALWPRVAMPVEPKRPGLGDFAKGVLLELFAPASALINRKGQGCIFSGPTDRYLRVAPASRIAICARCCAAGSPRRFDWWSGRHGPIMGSPPPSPGYAAKAKSWKSRFRRARRRMKASNCC